MLLELVLLYNQEEMTQTMWVFIVHLGKYVWKKDFEDFIRVRNNIYGAE